MDGIELVKKNIENIYEEKIAATIALCEWYAAKALQTFRRFQSFNEFWTNRTNSAYNRVFAENYYIKDEVGWFIAHAVEYGVYLEISNDRKHEALRPIVETLWPDFERDLKRIWE